MKLLVLFGPPAVGKMTIGKAIEDRSDFKLFHNHMVMDGIMRLFGVGSESEDRLSKQIRQLVIEEAAKSGTSLIFTYVWDFSQPKGKRNIDVYKNIYEEHGGEVVFVELRAPLETRMERAEHPLRKKHKAHAPDAVRVKYLEDVLSYDSPQPFFYPDQYYLIETGEKSPEEVAEKVVKQVKL